MTELVLKKIYPMMVSLAQEEFSNTNKSVWPGGPAHLVPEGAQHSTGVQGAEAAACSLDFQTPSHSSRSNNEINPARISTHRYVFRNLSTQHTPGLTSNCMFKVFSPFLGEYHSRPLGLGSDSGLQDRTGNSPSATVITPSCKAFFNTGSSE